MTTGRRYRWNYPKSTLNQRPNTRRWPDDYLARKPADATRGKSQNAGTKTKWRPAPEAQAIDSQGTPNRYPVAWPSPVHRPGAMGNLPTLSALRFGWNHFNSSGNTLSFSIRSARGKVLNVHVCEDAASVKEMVLTILLTTVSSAFVLRLEVVTGYRSLQEINQLSGNQAAQSKPPAATKSVRRRAPKFNTRSPNCVLCTSLHVESVGREWSILKFHVFLFCIFILPLCLAGTRHGRGGATHIQINLVDCEVGNYGLLIVWSSSLLISCIYK